MHIINTLQSIQSVELPSQDPIRRELMYNLKICKLIKCLTNYLSVLLCTQNLWVSDCQYIWALVQLQCFTAYPRPDLTRSNWRNSYAFTPVNTLSRSPLSHPLLPCSSYFPLSSVPPLLHMICSSPISFGPSLLPLLR